MTHLHELADQMMTAPISQIEAIYNEAWRRQHCTDDPKKAATLGRALKILEDVIHDRFYEITGKEGSYELKSTLHLEPKE